MTYQRAQLTLQRSGGFAGISTKHSVDTEQLDPKRKEDYLALLGDLDRAQSAGPPKSAPRQAAPRQSDQFQYELLLDLDGTRQRLQFSGDTEVSELRKLAQMITADSRGR